MGLLGSGSIDSVLKLMLTTRDDSVLFLPFGGLGEIGMNFMVLIHQDIAVGIDCGIMFPEAHQLGVDVIVPNIEFLRERNIPVSALIFTHGHEDHIGAIRYLYEELGQPQLIGTKFTLELVRDRLREQRSLDRISFVETAPGKRFQVGPFDFEALQVTHSIVDSMGLVIRTKAGTIVHTGDFKIDKEPVDGKRIDEERLKKLGEEGVDLLLSDSTNTEQEGWGLSESDAKQGLEEVITNIHSGKIIVSVFASNIHRIQSVIEIAQKTGRLVAFAGRSMLSNSDVAIRHDYLRVNPKTIISLQDVEKFPPEKVIILCTGTQAEPRSVLYKLSLNDHPEIELLPEDTVILSSRYIPGNEKAISHMVNNLYRRGAHVIDGYEAKVHASGHAFREEQRTLFRWLRPKHFLPVHGEYRMLVRHAELAEEVLPEVKTLVAENGELVEWSRKRFEIRERFTWGKVFLDEGGTDVHEAMLKDRRKLANTGVVVVSLVIRGRDGKIIEGPDFDIRGVNDEVDLQSLRDQIFTQFADLSIEAKRDIQEVEEEVRVLTRRFFRNANGIKPVVIPIIYEV